MARIREIIVIFMATWIHSLNGQGFNFCTIFPSICYPKPPPPPPPPTLPTPTTSTTSTTTTTSSPATPAPVIVGYISDWAADYDSFSASLSHLTHAIHAFVPVTQDGSLSLDNATASDFLRLQFLLVAKSELPLKTMFSVGAWGNSEHFSGISASPAKTQTFIASTLSFLEAWDMDGIDIDWESPVAGGATPGRPEDWNNFPTFLRKLRSGLDERGRILGKSYILTIASSGGIYSLEKGFDLPRLAKYVDWFNIMAYDMYGAWNNSAGLVTGPHAPLYFGAPATYTRRANVDYTLKTHFCQTSGLLSKLVLGLGFYGRYWNHSGSPVPPEKDPLWRHASSTEGDILDFRRVKRDFLSRPDVYKRTFHPRVEMPYLLSAGNDPLLMAYEDEESLAIKVRYAVSKGLRGVMIWAVEYDDEARTLLGVVKREMARAGKVDFQNDPPYKCSPLPKGEVRWWDDTNGGGVNDWECGTEVPLVEGYYAICNPENADAGCCSDKRNGTCGVGKEHCECEGCVNYYDDPRLAVKEPVKPRKE